MEAGSELVNRSGETLTEIVGSVKRVTDIIAEIAAASQEQTTGIDQVNRAVTQMDQVTQANAAQTEELSLDGAGAGGAGGGARRRWWGGSSSATARRRDAAGAGERARGAEPPARAAGGAGAAGDGRRARAGAEDGRGADAGGAGGGNGKGQHKDDGFEEF